MAGPSGSAATTGDSDGEGDEADNADDHDCADVDGEAARRVQVGRRRAVAFVGEGGASRDGGSDEGDRQARHIGVVSSSTALSITHD
jgi:hypothetical protein